MPTRFLLIVLASLNLAAGAGAAGVSTPTAACVWHLKASPHFDIFHESAWSPGSVSLEMEKMYSFMRLNLAMFAPWMVKEKTKIYIYSGQQSYLAGEFKPPRWSKGLAYSAQKTIVVYDTGDIDKLKAVIAHELTHLYFEGYFAEKLKYPPQWLNEGLAVYMEDAAVSGEGSWAEALAYFPGERRFPFAKFFSLKIDQLTGDSRIADWYLQSFGTVMYLYRPYTRLQFQGLCRALRSGEKLEDALWRGYRIRGPEDFANKWQAWAASYSRDEKGLSRPGLRSASFNFKPVRLSSFPFTGFGLKK